MTGSQNTATSISFMRWMEGKASGIETHVADMLGRWGKLPMTYAGGVASFDDLEQLRSLGRNRIDVTIGSALDIFGDIWRFRRL